METNFVKTKLKLILSSLIVAVILFLVISKGLSVGQQTAQAENVVKITQSLVTGLQNFYSDQDRFPSPLEFADKTIMLNYFSSFPPSDFASSACNQSFVYKRVSISNFQLNFCIPTATGKYSAGWNMVDGQPSSS